MQGTSHAQTVATISDYIASFFLKISGAVRSKDGWKPRFMGLSGLAGRYAGDS